MIKTKLRSQAGFTFIELIIYLAIVSSVLTSMILFSLRIMETRTKTKVIQEVQANTRVAIDTVSYLLRTADGVNVGSSSFDNDPGVLSLSTINPSTNPTIIALDQDNGSLTVTKGSGPTVPLTDTNILVTNLTFRNLTGLRSQPNVQVHMTVEYANPENDPTFAASQTITTNVMVRN